MAKLILMVVKIFAFSLIISLNLSFANQPNLLIIMTDEHNFRTLGCYREQLTDEQSLMWGKDVVETPHIDRIAHKGALFSSMYSSTPVCSPSRSSMFTGLYPQNSPVHSNDIILETKIPTLASVLLKEGYKTGYSGKWHLSGKEKPGWEPTPRYGFEDNRYMFNRGHWKKLGFDKKGLPIVDSVDKKNKPSYDLNKADEKSFTTDWLTDRTIEFIDEHKKSPFLYVVSYPDPHGPDRVREPYNKLFSKIKFELPRTYQKEKVEGEPSWTHPVLKKDKMMDMSMYYGMVKCIDDNVGRILTKLERESILENTIIVFCSDHGDLCGEHCRLNKGVPYEGSAKIPFLVHYPPKIKAGLVINEAANTTDWMDTFLTLMDVKNKPVVEGRDLTPLLTQTSVDWNDISFMRSTGLEKGWVAAMTDRYKLILATDGNPWLIDLEKDPDELTNYISSPEYSSITKKLASELKGYGKKMKDPRLKLSKIRDDLNKLL